MNYIDTHFHLDLCENYLELIEKIEKNKIYTIAVTNTPSVFDYTYNLTKNTKYIRTALGLHPELALKRKNEINLFKEKISYAKYIGEIGLDDNKIIDSENRKAQREVFEKIIEECSKSNDKILSIHSRGAQREINDIIGDKFPNKVILHWYSGSIKELEISLKQGFYFSVNIAMLKSNKGRNIINKIPVERILTESDGPFIKHNNKNSSPLLIEETVDYLASFLKMNPHDILNKIYENFKFLLSTNRFIKTNENT